MKTQKEKTNDKIELICLNVKQCIKQRDEYYNSLNDFTLSANKTDIVLKKMADLTSTIKADGKKILKLKGA